ncbi:MAG: hypothetical protein CME70_21530 [Halobacteriovorax sp.]|nr:hypothetical protein [Halobacteriovorax sp.]
MDKLKVAFRVKGGGTYGWGHVFRAISFARYLKSKKISDEIIFYFEGSDEVAKYIGEDFSSTRLEEGLSVETEKESWETGFDIVFVDMLEISELRANLLKTFCRNLCVFNDISYDLKGADTLIFPQGISAELTPKAKLNLVGEKFFIFQDQYRETIESGYKKEIRTNLESVFVCIGGSTSLETHQIFLEKFDECDYLQCDYLIGMEVSEEEIVKLSKQYPRIKFLKNVDEIADLISNADLAIITSGFIKYECALLGVPMILLSIVDHQEDLAKNFLKTKTAIYGGRIQGNGWELSEDFNKLKLNFEKRSEMSKYGQLLVNVDGPRKIIEEITKELKG